MESVLESGGAGLWDGCDGAGVRTDVWSADGNGA